MIDTNLVALVNLYKSPKDEMKEDLQKYCSRSPEHAHELLMSVATGLQEYKDKVEKQRDNTCSRIFETIIGFILTSTDYTKKSKVSETQKSIIHRRFHSVFDMVFYLFPDSNAKGGSTHMKMLLKNFIEDYKFLYVGEDKDYSTFDSWLTQIKGEEYEKWFNEIIKIDVSKL